MKKNSKKYILISVIILLVLAGFSAISIWKNKQKKEIISVPVTEKTVTPATVALSNIPKEVFADSLSLTVGDAKIVLPFNLGSNFREILNQSENSGLITFSGKDYPALGFFVTDIGALHQGKGKYLIYFINGKEASVGISTYIPQNSDLVEWKLD